jgi:hypothetical protein
VLLLSVGGAPTLNMQLAHDQLAAAGFSAILQPQLDGDLASSIEGHAPDLLVIEVDQPAVVDRARKMLRTLTAAGVQMPIVVGGAASSRLVGEKSQAANIARLEESLPMIEELLEAHHPVG